MREIQASEAKTHLPRLLSVVEHGETVIITRHGKPIARLVPEEEFKQKECLETINQLIKFRRTMPKIPLKELLQGRHEGHKY
jgi:prevent-host-death family protein